MSKACKYTEAYCTNAATTASATHGAPGPSVNTDPLGFERRNTFLAVPQRRDMALPRTE